MPTVLIIGDTHGNIARVTELTEEYRPDHVVLVGDVPVTHDAKTLSLLSLLSIKTNTDIRIVLGNHDDSSVVRLFYLDGDGIYRHSRLPGVSIVYGAAQWRWGRERFSAVSGAAHVVSEGREELPSLEGLEGLRRWADVLITHELSTPVATALFGSSVNPESTSVIDSAVSFLQPRLHVMGHAHRAYNDGADYPVVDPSRMQWGSLSSVVLALAGDPLDHILVRC